MHFDWNVIGFCQIAQHWKILVLKTLLTGLLKYRLVESIPMLNDGCFQTKYSHAKGGIKYEFFCSSFHAKKSWLKPRNVKSAPLLLGALPLALGYEMSETKKSRFSRMRDFRSKAMTHIGWGKQQVPINYFCRPNKPINLDKLFFLPPD